MPHVKDIIIITLYFFIIIYIGLMPYYTCKCRHKKVTKSNNISNNILYNIKTPNRIQYGNPYDNPYALHTSNNQTDEDLYIDEEQSIYNGEKYENEKYIKKYRKHDNKMINHFDKLLFIKKYKGKINTN